MRTIVLLIFASIFISNTTFSQNILLLKNGDKITGKLEEYKNDTITFRISESLLKFNKSNVLSITFDNVLSPTNQNEPKKEGRILGVVTYSISGSVRVSPDLGAKVYIADSVNLKDINWLLIDSSANINGVWASKYRQEYKLDRPAVKDITSRAETEVSKFVGNDNNIVTEVDLNGNYSAKVKPGTYYVLIYSNQRMYSTSSNITDYEKITINDGDDKYFNKRFFLKDPYKLF